MKFGIVRYSTAEEAPKTNKITKRLVTYYIENFRPFSLSQMELMGLPGIEARLQATEGMAKANSVMWQKNMEEAIKELCDQDVVIVIGPANSTLTTQLLRVAAGKEVNGLYMMDGVKKAAKMQGTDLKDTRVVIIDGKNRQTALALDMVCPHVNNLAVYTDRKENFMTQAEEIYEDCGLNLQLFSNPKGSIMAEADVIINCGYDMENYDYTIKKGAFYFDLVQNKPKLLRLLSRREDLSIADGMLFKKNGEFLSDRQAEAVYYVKNDFFRRYVCGRYDTWIAAEAEASLRHDELLFCNFQCMGATLRKN